MNTKTATLFYIKTLEEQNESYSSRCYSLLEAMEKIAACDSGAICCKEIAFEAIKRNKDAQTPLRKRTP